MIRVVLVEDQPLIRAGFRALLDAEDDIEVVGEAPDGREGVQVIAKHRPDVVLIDVQMPVMDGIETVRAITSDRSLTDVHLVVLTNYGLDEYVFQALKAGASGFLLKETEPPELLRAVRVAATGDALLAPAITRKLIQEYVSRPSGPSDPDSLKNLTEREREIVALVARGLSNQEIADHLFISPATAKTHVSRAMTKLAARDRAQLVVMAYETGLITPRNEHDHNRRA